MSVDLIKKDLYASKKTFDVALNANNNEGLVNNYILGICNTLATNTSLLQCTPQSIKDAAITSATLGVPIDARKLAYLIPYKGQAQFQLSYKGYVYMAKRDVEVDNIISQIVYEEDDFSVDLGENRISHIPNLNSKSYGKDFAIKFVYAIVRFRRDTGRDNQFEVMSKEQIDDIRASSQNGGQKDKWGNPTIWEKYYSEMARKTVIKRLCKHAQLGDIAQADEIDNAVEQGKIINVTPDGIVESVDLLEPDKDKILNAIQECNSQEQLDKVCSDNSEKLDEIAAYNFAFNREIGAAIKKKKNTLYVDKVMEAMENCEDEQSLDAVYNNHEQKIKFLKAALRDEVIEYYTELKGKFLDDKVV